MNNKPISMRGAALIQFVSKYSSVFVQLIVTAVLARLINPSEFGIVSIVTVFTSFFQLFSDMGISTAVVQYQDLDDTDYGSLFGFSAIFAIILGVAFILVSIPIASFYGEPRLVPVCVAASPTLIFSTLNMVPNGLMLKDRQFGSIGRRLIAATIISGAIAILLAVLGAGCFALVAQSGLSSLVVLVWNIVERPIKNVNLSFIATLKKIYSYSSFQFAFTFVNYFSRNLDNLITGRVFGISALGYYDKAYKLTTFPLSNVSSVVASVVQPYMASHQDDNEVIFNCFMRVEKVLSLLGAFVAAVFVASATDIIALFYGEQWLPSVPLFSILSVSVYFQMLSNPTGAFFQSLGRTDLMFKCGLCTAVLTVSGICVGVITGSLTMLALGVSIAYCVQVVPLIHYLFNKGFGVSWRCVSAFLPELICAVVAVAMCWICAPLFPVGRLASLIARLLLVTIVMLAGYAVTGQLDKLREAIR